MRQFYLLLFSVVFQGAFVIKVLGLNVEVTKNADWLYCGRCVEFTLKINVSSSTPLSVKALAPIINSKPQMRILGSTFNKDKECSGFTGSSKPVLTGDASSFSELTIDLGNVTVTGCCVIEVRIKFQLLKSSAFVHGQVLWPGFTVKHQNTDVFTAQEAVRGILPKTEEPILALTVEPIDDVIDASKPVIVNVKAALDCTRTFGSAASTKITILPPEVLAYSAFAVSTESIAVSKATGVGTELVFETSTLKYNDTIDFNITFTIHSSHAKKGRNVDFVTFYTDAIALPPTSNCPTAEEPFTSVKTTSTKMYTPFSTCDSGPGAGSNKIAYHSFSAPSYGEGAEPNEAKFTSSGAWKPSKLIRTPDNQYLQVTFKSMVKLRRFAIKGNCDDMGNDTDRYVKSVQVYTSHNGGIWKPIKEGSKIKIFEANTQCNRVAIVPFPYDIETKYIRVKPVDFENAIAMKVEFYGCKSDAAEFLGPINTIPNKAIIPLLNDIVVCDTGMDRGIGESSCYSSRDGDSWKAVHSDIKHIVFTNPSSGNVYAVGGQNGNSAFRTTRSKIHTKWFVISKKEFITEKAKSSVVRAVSGDDVPFTDDLSSPPVAKRLPVNTAGVTWGISGDGVYSSTDSGVNWKGKMVW